MLDSTARAVLDAPLARAAALLDRPGVTPDRLTAANLVLGLASAGRPLPSGGCPRWCSGWPAGWPTAWTAR